MEDVGGGDEEDYPYKPNDFKESARPLHHKKQVPSKHNDTSNILKPSKRELSNDYFDSDVKGRFI